MQSLAGGRLIDPARPGWRALAASGAVLVLLAGCGTGATSGADHAPGDADDAGDGPVDTFSGIEPPDLDSLRPRCGNGELDPGEMCDDGNSMMMDGCSRICQIEFGYVCPTVGQPCQRVDGGADGPGEAGSSG